MTASAALHLVRYCLRLNHTVSVWDGGDWQVKKSQNTRAIMDAAKSVGECNFNIRNSEGELVATALVLMYGVDADEQVADYSDNAFMAAWWKQYEERSGCAPSAF